MEGGGAEETVCESCYVTMKPFGGERRRQFVTDLRLTVTRFGQPRGPQRFTEGGRVVHTS
jgi:hypothetical protein